MVVRRHRPGRHLIAVVLALAMVASGCGVGPGGGPRSGPGGGSAVPDLPDGVSAKDLTFQPDVVSIERPGQPVVKRTDPDGAGFLLDGGVPGVDSIATGQVVLVRNEMVGRVTQVTPQGPDLHVRVDAVALTDVFRDGELVFDDLPMDPDQFRVHAWDDPDAIEPIEDTEDTEDGTGGGSGGGGPAVAAAVPAPAPAPARGPAPARWGSAPHTTTVSAGDYSLDLTYEAAAPSGFDLTIELTRNVFTARAGWLGVGDHASGKVSGTVKIAMRNVAIRSEYRIDDGKLIKGSQHVSFDGTAAMALTAIAGDTAMLAYHEVLSIPWETYRTVFVYGVPFLVLVRVKLLVAPAVSGVGTTLMFRTHADFAGSGVKDAAAPGSGGEGSGTADNDQTTNRVDGDGFGVAGMVFAVRPRLGLGLGVPGANAIGFGDAVISAGVVNGSSIGITKCRKLTLVVTVRVGAEAKIFGLSTEETHQLLKKKVYEGVAPASPACMRLLDLEQ